MRFLVVIVACGHQSTLLLHPDIFFKFCRPRWPPRLTVWLLRAGNGKCKKNFYWETYWPGANSINPSFTDKLLCCISLVSMVKNMNRINPVPVKSTEGLYWIFISLEADFWAREVGEVETNQKSRHFLWTCFWNISCHFQIKWPKLNKTFSTNLIILTGSANKCTLYSLIHLTCTWVSSLLFWAMRLCRWGR